MRVMKYNPILSQGISFNIIQKGATKARGGILRREMKFLSREMKFFLLVVLNCSRLWLVGVCSILRRRYDEWDNGNQYTHCQRAAVKDCVLEIV